MSVDEWIERAEELAEDARWGEALGLLREARRGRPPREAAGLQVAEGAILARAGEFAEALAVLELAEAMALGDVRTAGEARVTRASVLGAVGRFDEALPLLRRAVAELEGVDEDLHADAAAELASFENLVGGAHAGAFAAAGVQRARQRDE